MESKHTLFIDAAALAEVLATKRPVHTWTARHRLGSKLTDSSTPIKSTSQTNDGDVLKEELHVLKAPQEVHVDFGPPATRPVQVNPDCG